MKHVFFEKPYQPFVLTGLIVLCVAIFFRGAYPNSVFDVSIYNRDFNFATHSIWFAFAIYLFALSAIYFIVNRSKLRTKKWLVISHYVFIVLFLLFFAVFSAFASASVQKLVANIPLITLITLYGVIFLVDVIFFAAGILLLLFNVLSLRKSKS